MLPDGTLLSLSDVSVGFCDLKAHRGHVIPMGRSKRFAVLAGGRLALLHDGGFGVWNSRSKKAEIVLPGLPDTGPEVDLASLPDGRIATISDHGFLALWSLETGKAKTLQPAGNGKVGDRLFVLPDGRLAVVRSESIEVWSLSRSARQRAIDCRKVECLGRPGASRRRKTSQRFLKFSDQPA